MDMNVSRVWRDVAICLIGEGTTNVIATDVVKVLKGKIGSYVVAACDRWIKACLPQKKKGGDTEAELAGVLRRQWEELKSTAAIHSLEALTMYAREVMDRVGRLTIGVLLFVDALRDHTRLRSRSSGGGFSLHRS
jgi:hypothetical protein